LFSQYNDRFQESHQVIQTKSSYLEVCVTALTIVVEQKITVKSRMDLFLWKQDKADF